MLKTTIADSPKQALKATVDKKKALRLRLQFAEADHALKCRDLELIEQELEDLARDIAASALGLQEMRRALVYGGSSG